MNRRAFLAASAATATAATVNAANAAVQGPFGETGVPLTVPPSERLSLGPLPNSRYPDPHIEVLVKGRFKGSPGTGAVERIATGFRWAEGPAYFRAGRYLLFSDIPNNRMMRLLEDDNHLSVYRTPSMNSNGNTCDFQGRLVTCEHSGRRVTRTELDGTITIIADKYNNKPLNSPNDLAVASNGSIWFTDPSYGIEGYYEGLHAQQEQEKRNVYRVDGQTGNITVVADDFVQPNGITFSPDEKRLYVIDTGISHGGPSWIRVFDVDIDSGKLSNGKVFAEGFAPGVTDGMRCDIEGNLWCSMGWADPKEDGVRCYSPEGELLGKIHLPETVANLTFGGLLRNRLYICASTSLYACYVNTQGAMRP
ncbi:MAG: SMP-30/gluconolactonase/LRE family protein [Acetobacteraceae bacterium]|nr:SMP-30/gluconolactonase/LRE family protein [Acetobacteraceae bacterium]